MFNLNACIYYSMVTIWLNEDFGAKKNELE